MKDRRTVPPEKLRRTWSPADLGFSTTAELPPLEGLVGQERAVRSLEFGLGMKTPGYNIFVAGPPGTGKTSYTRSVLGARCHREPMADDWVYVHNFDRPDEPQALWLPAGMGPELARDVEELVDDARSAIGRALASKEHGEQRQALVQQARQQMAQVVAGLQETASRGGFALQQTEQGFVPVPVFRGQPLSPEVLEAMDPEARQDLEKKAVAVRQAIADAGRQMWELEKSVQEGLRSLDREIAGQALAPVVAHCKAKYAALERVLAYLDRVAAEMLHSLEALREAREGGEAESQPLPIPGLAIRAKRSDPFARFRVNVFVTRTGEGCPMVFETNPTYNNLFGKVEYAGGSDGAFEVSRIKAGALHRANGGYLILQAPDVLQAPFAWETLKRCLTNREVRIEPMGQEMRLVPLETVRPQPIPLDVKVILIGPAPIYYMLHQMDDAFRKLFRVKAEFDLDMPVTGDRARGYAQFLAHLCRRDHLRHLDAGAVARVLEHSHRLAEDKEKFSARFGEVVEVVYEANAWAEAAGSQFIRAEHVDQAIREKAERTGAYAHRQREFIERGILLVDTEGAVVGQVNGLTVMRAGDFSFGAPSRITAKAYMGEQGIIHIEREIHMSGQIHDKGLLTLSGFLGSKFAQDKPLALNASIAFEQTYGPVDGDSASSTELYALLSALAEAPVDQGIAVTGSVNQHGQVQPIGGVNEKIEGFFAVCKAKGLTGRQGVLIPEQNVPNLMLAPEVMEVIRAGQFHVWAASRIEEGIEILTSMPAGERQADGSWTPGSIFDRVDRRLRALASGLARFERG